MKDIANLGLDRAIHLILPTDVWQSQSIILYNSSLDLEGKKPLHCAKWVYSYRLCELVKHFFHKEGQVKADMPKYHGACLSKVNESKLCEARRRCSAETERGLVNVKGLHLHLLILGETKQKCAKECLLNEWI